MARVESSKGKPEKKEGVVVRQEKRVTVPVEKELNVGVLQEFLTQIKLFSLLKKQDPGTADFEKLKELELKLSSGDKEERLQAREKIDLFSVRLTENQPKANETLEWVVKDIYKGEVKPPELDDLVKNITKQNNDLVDKTRREVVITKEELSGFEGNLIHLKEFLGLKDETRGGLVQMHETLTRAIELRSVRRYIENPVAYEAPLVRKKDYFEEGSAKNDLDKKLTIRQAKKSERGKLENHLETTKKHVREELVEGSGEKLTKLSGEDLLDRLEEISDIKARMRNLVGNKHQRISETLEALESAEVQYQVALEAKIVADLRGKSIPLDDLVAGEAVREFLSDAKEGGRRAGGRARYRFDVPYEQVAVEVLNKAQSLEKSGLSNPGIERMMRAMQSGEEGGFGGGRRESFEDKVRNAKPILDKVGIDLGSNEVRENLRDKSKSHKYIEKKVEAARAKVSESEARILQQILEGMSGDKPFFDVQERLDKLSKQGFYGKYLVELKAYIARIGLRETSSDFQFAILLRNAKDKISKFEPDIADEFDSWQNSLFIPPVKSVNPEQYREVFTKVWNQGNLDHVLSPRYANAQAINVEYKVDGKKVKKTVSTAVFYQLLQETKNSTKLLDAPINSADTTMWGVLTEHLFGDGAKLEYRGGHNAVVLDKNGKIIFDASKGDAFLVGYFDLVSKKELPEGSKEKLDMVTLLDQITWMERYAVNFWQYSGEAGKHVRHYPKEDMENASKWILAGDQMYEGYGGHFGKYAPPYHEIAKVGHMLREIRSYKDSSVITGSIIETLVNDKDHPWPEERAKTFAKLLTAKLTHTTTIDEKEFKLGLLSVEEARLVGKYNNNSTALGSWNDGRAWLAAHGMPEDKIINASTLGEYIKLIGKKTDKELLAGLKDTDKKIMEEKIGWVRQSEEFLALCKKLQWSQKELATLEELKIGKNDLLPLAKKANTIFGGEVWRPENINQLMVGFSFAAVMDPSKYAQGSDPIEFGQKYMKLAEEVAKKLPKIQLGVATSKDLMELQVAMRAYLTPEEVDAYMEVILRTTIKSHTIQVPYEVAKLKDDQRTIDHHRLETGDGHTYYFIDRDGHRIAKKEKVAGDYFHNRFGTKTWRQSDVETLMNAMKGEAMIPRTVAENILDDLVGGGRTIDRLFKNFGIDTKTNRGAKIAKMVFARTKRFIGRLPLFDDPAWAAWSFSAELINFMSEASKEVMKGVVK